VLFRDERRKEGCPAYSGLSLCQIPARPCLSTLRWATSLPRPRKIEAFCGAAGEIQASSPFL
jgi:hypothetical protein